MQISTFNQSNEKQASINEQSKNSKNQKSAYLTNSARCIYAKNDLLYLHCQNNYVLATECNRFKGLCILLSSGPHELSDESIIL